MAICSVDVTFFRLLINGPLETNYFRMYSTDLHQIFIISTHMGGNGLSDLLSVIVRGTLLW